MARRAMGAVLGALVSIAFGVAVAIATRPGVKERVGGGRSRAAEVEDPDDLPEEDEAPRVRAALAPRPASRAAAPVGAPSVVFVVGCTVRRDQIGAYGAPEGVTPFLDGLAAGGVRFTDALSVSSWTREGVAGLITGRHPASLGLPDPKPGPSDRVLADEAVTLAERLAESGWVTLGVTANPNLNAVYGMAQGMDRYVDSTGPGFAIGRSTGLQVVSEALGLLDARAGDQLGRPFLLQVVLIDAHTPRKPPVDRIRQFSAEGTPAELARYRASLHEMDRALDQLDRGLRARGHDESNTVFVFVNDHGEGLGVPAHHGTGHGKKMYPSTVAMPWIVRGPGVPAGLAVDGLASGVDVAPTLLALLGPGPAPAMTGRDWSAWVRGVERSPLPQARAWSLSMFHGADVAAIWTPDRQCQKHYEHDRDDDVRGCFARVADPDFTTPIEEPALVAELDAWRAARLSEGGAFAAEHARVSGDVSEQLQVLGYLEE